MLTKEEFEDVLLLARITLTETEKEEFFLDFKDIISYINQIQAAKLDGVEPFLSLGKQTRLREDLPEKRDFSRDIFIENMPDKQDESVKIPPILKEAGFEL